MEELKTIDEEAKPCISVGERLVIDNKESDIVVWYSDYCMWLEKKYEELKNKQIINRMLKYKGRWVWETGEPTHWFPIPKLSKQ